MASASFQCVGYLAISPMKNGVLYPIYRYGNVNWPFVQEINAEGRISAFVEFFDSERFTFVASNAQRAVKEGDESLYAFFDGDGKLRELSFNEVGRAVRTAELDLADERLPLLTRLALARVGEAGDAAQSELLSRYLRSCGVAEPIVERLSRAEFRARLSKRTWWDQIAVGEFGEGYAAEQLRDSNTEEVFRWLFEHVVDEAWKRVFLVLARRVMFDERVFDLLLRFLGENPNFAEFSELDKLIVGRLIELYTLTRDSVPDVAEILYDELVSGQLFYVCGVVSPRVIADFVGKIIDEKEKGGDVKQVIDSIIDYISSDTANPSIAMPLFWFVVDNDVILEEYPSFSYYEGLTRLDRLIIEFQSNPRFQLNLSKDGRKYFEEILTEDE